LHFANQNEIESHNANIRSAIFYYPYQSN